VRGTPAEGAVYLRIVQGEHRLQHPQRRHALCRARRAASPAARRPPRGRARPLADHQQTPRAVWDAAALSRGAGGARALCGTRNLLVVHGVAGRGRGAGIVWDS
jgi:hypothetical protein